MLSRLVALNHYLTERVRRGLNTVLIIDEAQNLDAASLEQVRLLSNFETTTEKLLQILLVGQPELKAKLALPELRQLKQRIGLRCSIHSLNPADTAEYIHHRLATCESRGHWGRGAWRNLHQRRRRTHLCLLGRHSSRRKLGLRSLPARRVCRPKAGDRRRCGGRSHQLPRGARDPRCRRRCPSTIQGVRRYERSRRSSATCSKNRRILRGVEGPAPSSREPDEPSRARYEDRRPSPSRSDDSPTADRIDRWVPLEPSSDPGESCRSLARLGGDGGDGRLCGILGS